MPDGGGTAPPRRTRRSTPGAGGISAGRVRASGSSGSTMENHASSRGRPRRQSSGPKRKSR
jgi:hypothetical protein